MSATREGGDGPSYDPSGSSTKDSGGGMVGAAPVTPASLTQIGAVKMAAAVADLGAGPTMADFNGLLAKLRSAGILAT